MPSPDDIGAAARDAAQAYGVDQYAAGAASRQAELDALAAQERADVVTIGALRTQLAAALNQPPAQYVAVKAADLQAALDAGTWAYVNDEHFYTTPLQIPKAGAHIWLGDAAVLWRDFDSPGGPTRSALITMRDWTQPSGPISIRGTGRVQANSGRRGNVFSLWGQTVEILDITTDYFVDGRWFMGGSRDGTEIARVRFTCDPNADSGAGGVRIVTGPGSCHDCNDCTSGDDLWQMVPAGAPTDPFFNVTDVHDFTYSNNRRGRSLAGRLCVVGLQDKNDDKTTRLGMKSGVHDGRFEHIDGFGGKSGFVHQNKSSLGTITGTTTLDVVIDQADAEAGQRAEVYLNGVPATGGIDGINLSGVTILHPRPSKALYAVDGKVTNVVPPA